MDQIFSKKCPFSHGPCDPECAVLVEHSTPYPGMVFGYCGLLGPLLTRNATGMDMSPVGQRIYPSFYRGKADGTIPEFNPWEGRPDD